MPRKGCNFICWRKGIRAIDGISLSFNIPSLVESTVHGKVGGEEE